MKKVILFFFFCSFVLNATELKIVTEHFPPYQIYKDGKLSGISVDIVKEIQKRISSNYKINVLSWDKAYNLTLNKDNYIIFSMGRTVNREKKFKWVGPISKLKYIFFKNAKNKINIRNFADAKKVDKILVTKNDVSHQILEELNFKNLKVSLSQNNNENIKELANSKENILWASDYASGLYKIKQLGYQGMIKPTMFGKPLAATTINIGFSKNIDNSIVKKWQESLNALKADGTYQRILNKYQ